MTLERIGDIIRAHRKSKGLTQEELGRLLFVTKQSVSKWETGRSMPDLEMLRKLCEIFSIEPSEVLGGVVTEADKSRKWMKLLAFGMVICLIIALVYVFDIPGYLSRRFQSGEAYLVVFENGEVVSPDEYDVSGGFNYKSAVNGYKFDIDYGEIRGNVSLYDGYIIEYGFINTNNWHNVHIRLDVEAIGEKLKVVQTVSYESDNDDFIVLVDEATATEKSVSVFRNGV